MVIDSAKIREVCKRHTYGVVAGVVLLCCASLFLIPAVRDAARNSLASMLDNATKGTPLEGSGSYVRPLEIRGEVEPGTLAGNVIRSKSGLNTLPDGSFMREGKNTVGRVLEDANLSKNFVRDTAFFLVDRYTPNAQGDKLCTLWDMNRFVGNRMNVESKGARSALLRYIFQPTMLQGMYHLYVEYFLNCLAAALRQKCTPEETLAFYALLDQRISSLAMTLTAILADESIWGMIAEYERCDDMYEDVHARIAVERYDRGLSPSERENSEQIEQLLEQEQNALAQRKASLRRMIESLALEQDEFLTDDTLLFLILWVNRRLKEESAAREAVESAIQILYDLSVRFRYMAEEKKPPFAPDVGGRERRIPISATLVKDLDISEQNAEDADNPQEQIPLAGVNGRNGVHGRQGNRAVPSGEDDLARRENARENTWEDGGQKERMGKEPARGDTELGERRESGIVHERATEAPENGSDLDRRDKLLDREGQTGREDGDASERQEPGAHASQPEPHDGRKSESQIRQQIHPDTAPVRDADGSNGTNDRSGMAGKQDTPADPVEPAHADNTLKDEVGGEQRLQDLEREATQMTQQELERELQDLEDRAPSRPSGEESGSPANEPSNAPSNEPSDTPSEGTFVPHDGLPNTIQIPIQ